MAVGSSGRVVIEIDPELKRQLHAALEREGLTMKEWFLGRAQQYLFENVQLALRFGTSDLVKERSHESV